MTETPDTDPTETLVLAVHGLNVVVRDLVRRADVGRTTPGLAALASIHRNGPSRVSDVACDLQVSAPVASRQLGALEAAGQVARTADPDDHRAHRLTLTDEGEEALRDVHVRLVASFRTLLGDWDDDDVTRLAGDLVRLRDAHAEATGALAGAAPRAGTTSTTNTLDPQESPR